MLRCCIFFSQGPHSPNMGLCHEAESRRVISKKFHFSFDFAGGLCPQSSACLQKVTGEYWQNWFDCYVIFISHNIYWLLKEFLAQGIFFKWFCCWSCIESMLKIEYTGNAYNTTITFGFPATGIGFPAGIFYAHCFKSAWLRWKTLNWAKLHVWFLAQTPNLCLL